MTPAPGPARRTRGARLADLAPERTLRRLELTVTRRLDGLLNGEHLGLLPGPGTELAEARVYQPGEDDVRHMDWAVTARTTTPHVRDLIADHELEAWALMDLTPSMDFGTGTMVKRDLAVAALAAVGFLTVRLGDRVGAYLLQPGGMRRWPARTGKAAMYALLEGVLDAAPGPAGDGTGPRTGTPRPTRDRAGTTEGDTPAGTRSFGARPLAGRPGGLAEGISALDRGQTRRGLRVIISDFLPPAGDPSGAPGPDGGPDGDLAWERPLRRLAARHQVLAVEIIDPRELDLPDVGLVEMTDPETGAVHEIVLNRRVRERYAAAAAAQRERTRAGLRRCGAHHLVLRTDRDWVADVARFALRQRRAAGRAIAAPGVRT
ncbi:DUF58 domain-containing protein [Actinomadura viridis]|uniref:Uncharacterized protein (DUF58 family) n=1 Tax=Actinomadura viridis TaxID=58110 RepID=A0A931DGR0_9ACTN|nr:uncharacterized protein (DUF58 family) [Actinomadura viridis]